MDAGGKKTWTQTHRQWRRTLKFEPASEQAAFDDYLLAIEQVEEGIKTRAQHMQSTAARDTFAKPVGWLRCFRGIDTVTALSLVAELHGIERFASPRELMAYVGLVPTSTRARIASDAAGSPRRAIRTRGGC